MVQSNRESPDQRCPTAKNTCLDIDGTAARLHDTSPNAFGYQGVATDTAAENDDLGIDDRIDGHNKQRGNVRHLADHLDRDRVVLFGKFQDVPDRGVLLTPERS